MVLTLYKWEPSPPVRAVLMTIDVLKIPDVKYVNFDLTKLEHLSAEFIELNPQHTVPLLKHDDFVVGDSHAICAYLINIYGKDDSLYPKDPKKRAIVDQRLHFDSGILFPAVRDTGKPVLFHGQKKFKEEALAKIQSAYDFTDKFLTSDWIAGDDFTLADICCITNISSMNEILPIDKTKYKHLWAWFQRCSQLEFYKTKNEPGLRQLRDLYRSHLE